MVQRKRMAIFLFTVAVLTGCGRADVKETSALETAEDFPAYCSFTTGNVVFDCPLELPENFSGMTVPKLHMKEAVYPDGEEVFARYVEGKDVAEQHIDQNGDHPEVEEAYYILADGSMVGSGCSFLYVSADGRDYSKCSGALSYDAPEYYTDCMLESVNVDECIEMIKEAMQKAGYFGQELQFCSLTLSREKLEKRQQEYIQEGRLDAEDAREWTREDEGYIIWAMQSFDGIPVFHKGMNMGGNLSKDNPTNVQIQALCSSRGLEFLSIGNIYDLEPAGESLTLKKFDEITKTTAAKYNNIITEDTFRVKQAKLFQRVYVDERQKYEVQPVWYFEIERDGYNDDVMLVDAVTGKEIVLDVFM